MSRFRLVGWILLSAVLVAGAATAVPFQYHDYDQMVIELGALARSYPTLAEHFTAQAAWGLPTIPDGAADLEIHILRITNEALGLDKPEVLLEGTQHGDEIVSLEVCLAVARLLLESYGQDPWLTELVDRREIYLVPMSNPWGHNHMTRFSPGGEGSEDMNRDHIYDRCQFACSDEETLSTVGAEALHELSRRHLFRAMLDFHGGTQMIIHPWGTPLNGSPDDESPDHAGHDFMGLRMSEYGGPYGGLYPVGTSNQLLGAVHGPMDDSAYAPTWDAANSDPAWPTVGAGALAYTVEISFDKTPPASTLGGDADLLTPGGIEDGFVPKNVRIALAAIDAAEPWIDWTNRAAIPTTVDAGEPVDIEWRARGCFQVDDTRVRWGVDADPRTSFDGQSTSQSQTTGEPCFGTPTTFSEQIHFPTPGTYFVTPVARVDATLLQQGDPNPPGTPPRSWLVRSRTEEGLVVENATDPAEVNTVRGQIYWGAEPLEIQVGGGATIFADDFETGDISAWSESGT